MESRPGISVPQAVSQMLSIIEKLCERYPKKKFTLDGRLVGDLGEVLVEAAYDVDLYSDVKKHHDGETKDGRKVQIKATMKGHLTFPAGHTPDHYLAILIHKDGSFEEIFNGPGGKAAKAIEKRKLPKTNLHSVSIPKLRLLQKEVLQEERIPRRAA